MTVPYTGIPLQEAAGGTSSVCDLSRRQQFSGFILQDGGFLRCKFSTHGNVLVAAYGRASPGRIIKDTGIILVHGFQGALRFSGRNKPVGRQLETIRDIIAFAGSPGGTEFDTDMKMSRIEVARLQQYGGA